MNIQKYFEKIRFRSPILFRWLVRRKWLYPEPIRYQNNLRVSGSFALHAPVTEIAERLIEEASFAIFDGYVKWKYFPVPETIRIERREEIVVDGFTYRITWEARYRPHGPNFRDAFDTFTELRKPLFVLL